MADSRAGGDGNQSMMAATPALEPVDLREQLAHIDRMRVELQKLNADTLKVLQETTLATPRLLFLGALTMAAMIGTVAAIVKLFYSARVAAGDPAGNLSRLRGLEPDAQSGRAIWSKGHTPRYG